MRSGSQALSLLAAPLNVCILQALGSEPTPLADLRREVGHPPVTTMRSYLRNLTERGVLERHREDDFPGSVSYSITPAGKGLLKVADIVRVWLEACPDGSLEAESLAAKSSIKALLDGWEVGLVRALAARSLALTELSRLIPQISYPTLERRLTAMRQVGLVEPDPQRNGRVAPCRVTPWLRQAVAPLVAAVGWECEWDPGDSTPPARMDVEAGFLLAVPLLELAPETSGTCRLAVEFRRRAELDYAGVVVTVEDGEVRSCVTRLEGRPDGWASGSVLDWCSSLRGEHLLETGGDVALASAIGTGLQAALVPMIIR